MRSLYFTINVIDKQITRERISRGQCGLAIMPSCVVSVCRFGTENDVTTDDVIPGAYYVGCSDYLVLADHFQHGKQ